MAQPRRDERWSSAPFAYDKCTLDGKGRLNLPTSFQRWMEKLDTQFFVTSWSGVDVQVYTREGFMNQIHFLEEVALEPDKDRALAAKRSIFNGRRFGRDVEMDSEGRITLSQELRQKLPIEKLPAPFYIGADRDHFTALTAANYLGLAEAYESTMPVDAELMQSAGLR